MERTITKKEALEICSQCDPDDEKTFTKDGCIRSDIESWKESGKVPECMRMHFSSDVKEKTQCQPTTNAQKNMGDSERTHINAQKSAFSRTTAATDRQVEPPQPTKTEEEYIALILAGFNTPNKIRVERDCQIRIVQQTLKNMREKGIINEFNEVVRFEGGYSAHSAGVVGVAPKQVNAGGGAKNVEKDKRLHAQQLWIGILEKTAKYKQYIHSVVRNPQYEVRYNEDSIEIYAIAADFWHPNCRIAFMMSVNYWMNVISIIENDCGITLMKDRMPNIKFVKAGEYGEVGNELAIQAVNEGEYIRVYDKNGKLWLVMDFSHGQFRECETVDHQRAMSDMQDVVSPHFNDLRENPWLPKPSKMYELQAQTATQINQLVGHLNKEQMKAAMKEAKEQLITEVREELKRESTGTTQPPDKWDMRIYG